MGNHSRPAVFPVQTACAPTIFGSIPSWKQLDNEILRIVAVENVSRRLYSRAVKIIFAKSVGQLLLSAVDEKNTILYFTFYYKVHFTYIIFVLLTQRNNFSAKLLLIHTNRSQQIKKLKIFRFFNTKFFINVM